MITKRRDSVATLHHIRNGGHHSNGTLEAHLLWSYQLIDLPRETHHPRTFRVTADT